jgi:SAM-dependent methyltransferase
MFDVVRRVNAAADAAGVRESIAQFDNIATHAQYRFPYDLTASHVRPGDRVLDWGAGNAHFSFFVEWLGATATAFSFEEFPPCMSHSPTFRYVPADPSDPKSLPFADGAFDVAAGVGVLEHVWETGGDERSSLRELARVLKPGGTLLTFHLPNRGGWIERTVQALGLKKHFHKRKFDEREIRSLWTEAGFDVVALGRYNALPRTEIKALPGAVKHSRVFAAAYELLDNAIASILPGVCTNFFVVARRTM